MVANKQRWLAGRGNDCHVIRVHGQLDVAGWDRHVIDVQTEQDRRHKSALRHASPHDTTDRCGRLEGRLERPVVKVRGYGFNQVGGEVEGR